MMVNYSCFSDMCFDTIYRLNNDGRPFALLVVVYHRRKTVIFGVAWLYDETTLTFE